MGELSSFSKHGPHANTTCPSSASLSTLHVLSSKTAPAHGAGPGSVTKLHFPQLTH